MQYRQAVHSIAFWPRRICVARSMASHSAGESGLSGEKVATFSAIISGVPMPERTISTPGSPAAKRSAKLAGEPSPAAASASRASSGRLTRRPPLTGSITMTGLPWAAATSQHARLWMTPLSQSR